MQTSTLATYAASTNNISTMSQLPNSNTPLVKKKAVDRFKKPYHLLNQSVTRKTRPIDCCYRDFLELFGHLPVYRFEKYKKPKCVDATTSES